MIFLYTLVLFFLGAVKLLIDRRVARLERKYASTAKAAEDIMAATLANESEGHSDGKADSWLVDMAGTLKTGARKEGNSNRMKDGGVKVREAPVTRLDLALRAKHQYQLALLVQKRDTLEARHEAWQARADRVGAWLHSLRHWKGRKLPYTFGVIDVSTVMYLVDRFGLGDVLSLGNLVQMVESFLYQ